MASALALPSGPVIPYGAPPVAYGEVKIPPRPFAYAYGVSDNYSGANFDKKETQDEHGVVQGEYRVALPDGRTQIVTYHADHVNGYALNYNHHIKTEFSKNNIRLFHPSFHFSGKLPSHLIFSPFTSVKV